MKKKTIMKFLSVIFLLIALGCGGYLGYYYYTSAKTEKDFERLEGMIEADENTDDVSESAKTDEDSGGEKTENKKYSNMIEVNGVSIQKKFEKLYRANSDFVGWVKIKDTKVSYPVMYSPWDSENGEYYIHRNFEENYSASGLPFIDSNCKLNPATDNVIIYGHNMNSGTMFHDIMKYEDKEFYENHKTFTFDTIYEDGEYEVIAVFYGQILDDNSDEFKYYEFVNAGSEEEFMDYISNIMKMSIIDTGVDVRYGDKLVTLSTCAYHVKDGRFAVVAKKIDGSN